LERKVAFKMLTIQLEVLRALQAHGEAAYPNEGAGLLLGRAVDGGKTVVDILPLANRWEADEQHHRFLLTDQEWRLGETEAERRNLELIGCFHSHPNHVAEPSEFDREAALPNFIYIITTVEKASSTISRAWLLKDDRSAFEEAPMELADG
jgi:proteasome lid subunit RPN8/RPN11